MIIIAPDSKQSLDSKAHPDEPPPSYSSQTTGAGDPIASGSVPSAFKTKPTNFLLLAHEQNSIRGEFVIDPGLRIPSALLPPLDDGETENERKNLRLKSHCGSVDAEIWLLSSAGAGERPREEDDGGKVGRTTVALTSDHGSVRARVHTLDGAAPLSLTARAAQGSIRLAIPRSFQGLLALSTRHGSVQLSDALVQNVTQLSQLGTTRRYFVGDFGTLGEDVWQGDEVEMDAPHGTVRVSYVDEVPATQGKRGFFGWLLNR